MRTIVSRSAEPPADAEAASAETGATRAFRAGRRSRMERRTVLALGGVAVGAWILIVFAGLIADASEQRARAAQEQTINDAKRAQLDAGQRELELVRSRAFLDLRARAFGLGETGERVFAIRHDAPAPPVLVPLGADLPTPVPVSVTQEWLDLLFGS